MLGTISPPKSGDAVAQAARGHGRVPIPGGVQDLCRCGTWGRGQWARWVGVGGLEDLSGISQPQ